MYSPSNSTARPERNATAYLRSIDPAVGLASIISNCTFVVAPEETHPPHTRYVAECIATAVGERGLARTLPMAKMQRRTNYVPEGARRRQHIDPVVLVAPCSTVARALILLRPGEDRVVRHHCLKRKCISVHCRDEDIHITL